MSGLNCDLNLILTNSDDLKKAISALSEWGCCPRCILRFLGEKEQHVYRKPTSALKEWVRVNTSHTGGETAASEGDGTASAGNTDTKREHGDTTANGSNHTAEKAMDADTAPVTSDPPSDSQEDVCVSCLGMLQDDLCSPEFLQKIKDVVDKGGHEYHNYFCSVSTPVNVCLREQALWLALKQLLPKDFIGEMTEDDVASIKEIWKWINGRPLGNLLGTHFSMKSDFTVSLNFTHPSSQQECSFLLDLFPNIFRQRKNNKNWEVFTRVNVMQAIRDTREEKFRKNFCCPPRRLSSALICDPLLSFHEPVFLAGRYNKYSRTMSQTPWLLDTGRKTNNSVEEVICLQANKWIKAKEYRFASSGREDVDVRMLGRGRPFVVEFIDPRKESFTRAEMGTLQKEINASTPDVQVRDLQLVTRADTQILKSGEEEKVKKYSALCYATRPLTDADYATMNGIRELVLQQTTPIRVLHRRPLATRPRSIHTARGEPVDERHFRLSLTTQAGTYIKEFVHGDFGRTAPNLGQLLDTECDILELDVEDVMLDWPKAIDYPD